jgi:GNAT superfamily N-acetyltransferase
VITVREAEADDLEFLEQMLAVAADWRALTPRPVREVLAIPELARYIDGWPRPGDFGVVAEQDVPVGAAWWRHFSGRRSGYGFVDDNIPEISIGVVAQARGAGTGTLLLEALINAARERSLRALSLSVDLDNDARRLYQRFGFREVDGVAGSATLVLPL